MTDRAAEPPPRPERVLAGTPAISQPVAAIQSSAARMAANISVTPADNAPFIVDLRLMGVRI